MTVYVDTMRASYGRMIMCHMIADTDEELRAMADMIGVAQRWHQGDHFDIALSKKAAALANGAIEITWREAGCMIARQKVTGELGAPSDAVAWVRAERQSASSKQERQDDRGDGLAFRLASIGAHDSTAPMSRREKLLSDF